MGSSPPAYETSYKNEAPPHRYNGVNASQQTYNYSVSTNAAFKKEFDDSHKNDPGCEETDDYGATVKEFGSKAVQTNTLNTKWTTSFPTSVSISHPRGKINDFYYNLDQFLNQTASITSDTIAVSNVVVSKNADGTRYSSANNIPNVSGNTNLHVQLTKNNTSTDYMPPPYCLKLLGDGNKLSYPNDMDSDNIFRVLTEFINTPGYTYLYSNNINSYDKFNPKDFKTSLLWNLSREGLSMDNYKNFIQRHLVQLDKIIDYIIKNDITEPTQKFHELISELLCVYTDTDKRWDVHIMAMATLLLPTLARYVNRYAYSNKNYLSNYMGYIPANTQMLAEDGSNYKDMDKWRETKEENKQSISTLQVGHDFNDTIKKAVKGPFPFFLRNRGQITGILKFPKVSNVNSTTYDNLIPKNDVVQFDSENKELSWSDVQKQDDFQAYASFISTGTIGTRSQCHTWTINPRTGDYRESVSLARSVIMDYKRSNDCYKWLYVTGNLSKCTNYNQQPSRMDCGQVDEYRFKSPTTIRDKAWEEITKNIAQDVRKKVGGTDTSKPITSISVTIYVPGEMQSSSSNNVFIGDPTTMVYEVKRMDTDNKYYCTVAQEYSNGRRGYWSQVGYANANGNAPPTTFPIDYRVVYTYYEAIENQRMVYYGTFGRKTVAITNGNTETSRSVAVKSNEAACLHKTNYDLYVVMPDTITAWKNIIYSSDGERLILNKFREALLTRYDVICMAKIDAISSPLSQKILSNEQYGRIFFDIPIMPPLLVAPNTLAFEKQYYGTGFEVNNSYNLVKDGSLDKITQAINDKTVSTGYQKYIQDAVRQSIINTVHPLINPNLTEGHMYDNITNAILGNVAISMSANKKDLSNYWILVKLPSAASGVLDIVYNIVNLNSNIKTGDFSELSIDNKYEGPMLLFGFDIEKQDSQSKELTDAYTGGWTTLCKVSIPMLKFEAGGVIDYHTMSNTHTCTIFGSKAIMENYTITSSGETDIYKNVTITSYIYRRYQMPKQLGIRPLS